jgi:NADPH-dependent ferric siderophore reductase
MPVPEPRAPRPQVVLEVLSTEWIAADLVRVTAGGPGFADFQTNEATDKYAKLVFVKPGLGLTPPYDVAALREQLPQEDWPVVRTYTIRAVDPVAGTMSIDFVVHGDEGVAGPWAASARPGDPLVLSGPGGGYAPDPAADAHVLAGDHSAVPAISSALEALPQDARGLVLIEGGELPLTAPAGVTVLFVEDLAAALAAADWPAGDVQVFAHGERESMKALRDLFAARDVPRSRLSLSGYWARGRTEDRFQAEKREPIGKIL